MAQMEGEKELVLGNKQLMGLFFVVVALCGVFFAMGYMMGRPSAKTALTNPETGQAAAVTAPGVQQPVQQQPEPPRETAETAPPTQTTARGSDSVAAAPAEPQPQPAPIETKPARDTPPLAPVASAPAAPPAAAPEAATPAAGVTVPQEGATYLQVTALLRSDADKLAKTLREQNFPALVAESSKPDLFRVMVGPYHQTADVADATARLKALGFANAFVQK
jgi:cell division septation protein DedD